VSGGGSHAHRTGPRSAEHGCRRTWRRRRRRNHALGQGKSIYRRDHEAGVRTVRVAAFAGRDRHQVMLEAPGVAPVWWTRVAPLIVETMTARCAEWVRWFNADRLHSSNDRVWCGLVRHPSTAWMLPRRGGMSSHWRRSRYEKFRSDVIALARKGDCSCARLRPRFQRGLFVRMVESATTASRQVAPRPRTQASPRTERSRQPIKPRLRS